MKPSAFPWYVWIGAAIISAVAGIALISIAMAHEPSGSAGAIIFILSGMAMVAVAVCLAVVGVIRMVKWALQD